MCLRDKNYPDKAAFLFLEDIKDRFFQIFSEIDYKTAIPNGLNAKFRETLKSRMEYFRKNYNEEDKLGMLRRTLNETKNEIMQTDDALSARSEKITLIVDKAENIKTESKSYYSWSKKVKMHTKWRKIKLTIVIIAVILIIAFFISVLACGIDFSRC